MNKSIAFLAVASLLPADTLVLKTGQRVDGDYLGGDTPDSHSQPSLNRLRDRVLALQCD